MAQLNPVLSAYIQGSQEKEALAEKQKAAEQQDFENTQKQKQIKMQEQQLKETHQQHLDTLKQAQDTFDAQQNKDKAEHTLKIQTLLNTISQAQREGKGLPGNAQVSEDKTKATIPEIGTINLENETEYAAKQAELDRITGAPANEFKQKLQETKDAGAKELAATKQKGLEAINAAKINSTEKVAREKAKADLDRELAVARVRGGFTIQAAQIAAQAAQAKIDRNETKVSPADLAKLDSFSRIEKSAVEAQKLLNDTGYSYYEGPQGLLSDAGTFVRRGEGDETNARIVSALGSMRQAVSLADSGKTLTNTELAMINTHIPDISHAKDPIDAKVQLEDLLSSIAAMRQQVYLHYDRAAVPTATNSNTKTDSNTRTISTSPVLGPVKKPKGPVHVEFKNGQLVPTQGK